MRLQLDKPWVWQLAVIALALGYTFATGPFRAPDEPNHFFRAYQISEGHLVAKRVGRDLLGDELPLSLALVASAVDAFPNLPAIQTSKAGLTKAWKVKLKKGTRGFLHFPGAAMHSPLVYLPAALALATGRILHAQPLALLYTARCFNAVLAGALIGLALSRVWRHAPYLVILALAPMCLFQAGTVTADAVTFAIAFLWYSEVLSARMAPVAQPSPVRWGIYALVLSQLRFPYPLIGLLVFAFPHTNLLRFRSIFLSLLFLPSLLWMLIVQGLWVQMRPLVEVNSTAQLQHVFSHPIQFAAVMSSTLAALGYEYWRECIGVFGWLTLPVPTWILLGVTLSSVITICSSDLLLNRRLRFAFLSLSGFCLLLTALLAYLAWNAVGAPLIEGWQGRYAIPLLPLLAAALANRTLRQWKWLRYASLAFSMLANIASIILLARATYS